MFTCIQQITTVPGPSWLCVMSDMSAHKIVCGNNASPFRANDRGTSKDRALLPCSQQLDECVISKARWAQKEILTFHCL